MNSYWYVENDGAKRLRTLYQVCYNEQSGLNTLHTTMEDAVKEAQQELEAGTHHRVLHICEIKEVVQVTRKDKV
jgi:hypothetical protein